MSEANLKAELDALREENAKLKRRPQGMQREGLRAGEVLQITKLLKQLIDDGEDPDVAYNIACRGDQNRPIVGISPATFQGWKKDIFALMQGLPTPANSMLSGAEDPAAQKEANLRSQGRLPQNAAMAKRVGQLGAELDATKKDHERLTSEKEEADAELAKLREENAKLKAAALGDEPPAAAPKKPVKPT